MRISDMLRERKLPSFQSRDAMIDLLLRYEYGYMPDLGYEITVSDPVRIESRYCGRTVEFSRVNMTVNTKYGSHTFPIQRMLHTDGTVNPFFVYLSFFPEVPNQYYPAEEVADGGFDVLSIAYKDVTADNDDFTDGLPGIFLPNGQQSCTDCGKLMYWAWAAMRVLDYAQTLPQLDMSQAAVLGHSRLGVTALLTGMLDTRFRYVFSNNAGCSGAALARGNTGNPRQQSYDPNSIFDYEFNYGVGETIRDIVRVFPHWFCKNYHQYITTNIPDSFDQHYVVASIAPRFAYIASASTDLWADPVSEFLCAAAGSEYYEKFGLTGLVHNDALPAPGDCFPEGRVGYHMRKGPHFLSRHDWNRYMDYMRHHRFDFIPE